MRALSAAMALAAPRAPPGGDRRESVISIMVPHARRCREARQDQSHRYGICAAAITQGWPLRLFRGPCGPVPESGGHFRLSRSEPWRSSSSAFFSRSRANASLISRERRWRIDREISRIRCAALRRSIASLRTTPLPSRLAPRIKGVEDRAGNTCNHVGQCSAESRALDRAAQP